MEIKLYFLKIHIKQTGRHANDFAAPPPPPGQAALPAQTAAHTFAAPAFDDERPPGAAANGLRWRGP
jgi:hypothetical protein